MSEFAIEIDSIQKNTRSNTLLREYPFGFAKVPFSVFLVRTGREKRVWFEFLWDFPNKRKEIFVCSDFHSLLVCGRKSAISLRKFLSQDF